MSLTENFAIDTEQESKTTNQQQNSTKQEENENAVVCYVFDRIRICFISR